MATINSNYENLQGSYLFANISRKVEAFKKSHPEADIIRLGIGDSEVMVLSKATISCAMPSLKAIMLP